MFNFLHKSEPPLEKPLITTKIPSLKELIPSSTLL